MMGALLLLILGTAFWSRALHLWLKIAGDSKSPSGDLLRAWQRDNTAHNFWSDATMPFSPIT